MPTVKTFPVKIFLCNRHCLLGPKHRCLQRVSLLFKSLSPTRARNPKPDEAQNFEPVPAPTSTDNDPKLKTMKPDEGSAVDVVKDDLEELVGNGEGATFGSFV